MDEPGLKIDLRVGGDRRQARPFGTNGPWLSQGKMGGLIITNRRKSVRRATDKQEYSSQSNDFGSIQNGALVPFLID